MKNLLFIKQRLILALFVVLTISKLNSQIVIQNWATLATGADPYALTIDASGNLYTANNGNSTISKISPAGICTNNWATLSANTKPKAIAVSKDGSICTANDNYSASRILSPGNANQLTQQTWISFNENPQSILFDTSGNLYVLLSSRISVYDGYGTQNNNTNLLHFNNMILPSSFAINASGILYTADYGKQVVSKFDLSGWNGTYNWAFVGTGAAPVAIAVDASGNVYTTNASNNTVSKITPTGICTRSWVTLASGANPSHIAIDANGNVYITNNGNNTVSKITPTGICTQSWVTLTPRVYPRGIAIDANGNIFILNSNCTISKISNSDANALPEFAADGIKVYCVSKSIMVDGATLNSNYSVYSVSGLELISGKLTSNKIGLNNLQTGIYFVKINNEIAKVILK